MGIGGAEDAWDAFLRKFLNIQSNQFFSGESILVASRVDTDDLMSRSSELNAAKAEDIQKLRALVAELDQRVVSVIKHIHEKEGYLEKYFVFGLHEAYNSKYLIDKAEEGEFLYITHDSIVRGDVSLSEALSNAIDKIIDQGCGPELDIDGITGAPSSAQTPSGFTPEQARYLATICMKKLDVKYVHISEGAPSLEQNGDLIIGKLISYLVSDICKVVIKKS